MLRSLINILAGKTIFQFIEHILTRPYSHLYINYYILLFVKCQVFLSFSTENKRCACPKPEHHMTFGFLMSAALLSVLQRRYAAFFLKRGRKIVGVRKAQRMCNRGDIQRSIFKQIFCFRNS